MANYFYHLFAYIYVYIKNDCKTFYGAQKLTVICSIDKIISHVCQKVLHWLRPEVCNKTTGHFVRSNVHVQFKYCIVFFHVSVCSVRL